MSAYYGKRMSFNYPKKNTAATTIQRAFRNKKNVATMSQVKRYLERRTEKKLKVEKQSSLSIANNGATKSFCLIAQGDDVSNREGMEVFLKNITIDVKIHPSTGLGSASGDLVRVALVYDNQPSRLQASYGTVYDLAGGASTNAQAHRDMTDWQQRFKIIWEEQTCITNQAVDIWDGTSILTYVRPMQIDNAHYKKFVDLEKALGKNAMIRWGDSTAGVPTIGNLFLCWCSNVNSPTASENPSISFTSQMRYVDK